MGSSHALGALFAFNTLGFRFPLVHLLGPRRLNSGNLTDNEQTPWQLYMGTLVDSTTARYNVILPKLGKYNGHPRGDRKSAARVRAPRLILASE